MSSRNSRKDIESLLRDSLSSSFVLYESSHHVQAHGSSDCLDIEYQSLPFLSTNKFKGVELHFGLRGEGHGFLGWVLIPKPLRGNGYGSSLMSVAEKVLRDLGCSEIELTPSGDGKLEFYGKRGYVKTDSPFDVMVKRL